MKFFTASTLFAAALVSVVVCIPFLPSSRELQLFSLEVKLQMQASGRVQVYYDSGRGFAEERSSSLPLKPGPEVVTYDLALPAGESTQFRFDPIDRDAAVTLYSIRVVNSLGTTVRKIAFTDLHVQHDIAALRPHDDALDIVPTAHSQDPQLLIPLTPPLQLTAGWLDALIPRAKPIVAVFLALAVLLAVLDRVRRIRALFGRGCAFVGRTPRRAVFCVAAVAVVASSYPVVFLGKSYVSPNMGTQLLYDQFPVLPGYNDTTMGEVMGSDIGAIMWQHVPLSMVERRALLEGEAPLWNRYNSAGTPLLGQGQSMFGDPLHFLVIVANGASWAWDLKYLIAKWLFAVALGFLALEVCLGARTRSSAVVAGGGDPGTGLGASNRVAEGAGPGSGLGATGENVNAFAAALIVAAVAPFIGFFVYRFNHPAFFSMCYAPWALYCWIRAVRAPSLRATTAWAGGLMLANLALMNSGTAKEAYMLLLTMNFAGACALASVALPWRTRLMKLGLLLWAGVLFVLITAPIWATFRHEMDNAYTSYNAVSAYQIQPTLLLGAFDEIFYRPLMANGWTFSPSMNFVLLLGVLYFAATLREQFTNRLAIGLAAASLVPLSLAFGLVPPEWIVRIPVLANVAHIDNTFSCALIILWTVLAGVGFASAARRLGTREGRGDLIIVALFLGALVFGWIAFGPAVHRPIFGPVFSVNEAGHRLPVSAFIWFYLASLLIAAAVFMVCVRRAFVRGTVTPALALMIGLCAVVFCWRFALHTAAVPYPSYVLRPTLRVPFHADSPAIDYLKAAQEAEPTRVYGLHSNFFPGWNDTYALETIHGPDALMSPWYRELVGALPGVRRIWDWRLYLEPENVSKARPFLDSLNVRFYVDQHTDPKVMEHALRLSKQADLDVYESPTVWPRAFFADRLTTYTTVDDLVQRIGHADGHPFAAMQTSELHDAPSLLPLTGRAGNASIVPATHYHLTENTTAFDVHAPSAGVLVLLESWWPGDFRAFVNGKKVPVLRLNHAFKGVAVEAAGDYHIEFRCVPKGWYRNLALCGAGFVMLIATGLIVTRTRRNIA